MYPFSLQHLECFIGFKNHRWCELVPIPMTMALIAPIKTKGTT